MSRPREGWLSIGLVLVMVLTIAWSVDAAGWLPRLDFLVVGAILSVAAGTAAALSTMRNLVAVAAGAVGGGAVIVWSVGGEYFAGLDQLARLLALREELLGWLSVVTVGGYPTELTPYALGLGMLLWTTGFMTAFATFRHHRALDGVLMSGAAMIANMSATYTDLFPYLVLFVLAALLLLLRSAVAERQLTWQARRLSQTDEVPLTIMRSGVTFAITSVVVAWALTTVAVAAPLTNAWAGLDGVWSGVSDSVGHIFGNVQSPNSRLVDTSFGSQMNVTGTWESRDGVVLRYRSERPFYLRTTAYDVYTGRGWHQSPTQPRTVPPNEAIFAAAAAEHPGTADAGAQVEIQVEMENPVGRSIFTPGHPLAAGLPVLVRGVGQGQLFGGLEAVDAVSPGDAYALTAYVSSATQAQLAAASREYPPAITARYLDTTGVTDATRNLAREIAENESATDAYHQAEALAAYLRTSPLFTYDTQAGLPPDAERDLVDFFLFDEENGRRGYCQYYASAMVMMARSLGLPARVVAGFAPTEERDASGAFVVRQRNAHAWAEIYFPGYGWEIFEATKTIDPQFTRLPGTPGEGAEGGGGELDAIDPRFDRSTDLPVPPLVEPIDQPLGPDRALDGDRARGGNALLLTVLMALAAVPAFLFFRRSRKRWQLLPAGDRTWRQLERVAGRAGVAARPAETVYEYAGWLEEQLPARRPEIRTVAEGKVWADYSGRVTPPGRQALIERAWSRLRMPLLMLLARRRLRALLRQEGRRG